MDTAILRLWLKAGYMEKRILHPTDEGSPQGGPCTPPTMLQSCGVRA